MRGVDGVGGLICMVALWIRMLGLGLGVFADLWNGIS